MLFLPNKGKVFFKQKRIGLGGKEFTVFKFRTLTFPIEVNIEKDPDTIKMNSHPVGIFLRKTGLDEILQLINVLKGDMYLIGPRPLIKKDLDHLTEYQFMRRHEIKPGIVGLWQIRRKYNDDSSYFKYDDFYIRNHSLSLDIFIVYSTIEYMLKRKGR